MTRHFIGLRAAALLVASLAAALPAFAQQHELVGKWEAVNQPGKWIDFKANGEVHYLYSITPVPTRLMVNWKTGWFHSLTLSQIGGGGARSCKYAIDGDSLTIDDGSGKSCIENQPVNMAMKFRRAK